MFKILLIIFCILFLIATVGSAMDGDYTSSAIGVLWLVILTLYMRHYWRYL
jgi:hypothetical protein